MNIKVKCVLVEKVAVLKISNLASYVDLVIRGNHFQPNALFMLISSTEWNFSMDVAFSKTQSIITVVFHS